MLLTNWKETPPIFAPRHPLTLWHHRCFGRPVQDKDSLTLAQPVSFLNPELWQVITENNKLDRFCTATTAERHRPDGGPEVRT